LSNGVIEDSQSAGIGATSVDGGEPVNSIVSVHPVALRVELKRIVTARICNVVMPTLKHVRIYLFIYYTVKTHVKSFTGR